MKRAMNPLTSLIFASAATLSPGNSPRQCEFRTDAAAPQRVEVYTSEGCSSCPPADRWFSTLQQREDQILLAFHVDYWNDLGWPDRFSDARYSARQRDQAKRIRSRTVYTPEVLVDGAEYRGWRNGLPINRGATAPPLMARVTQAQQFTVQLDAATGYPKDALAYLAITEDGLRSEVQAGENRGLRLQHDHVVRAYADPGPLDRPLTVTLPADIVAAQARWMVWIEDTDGRTVQALSRPLGDCAGTVQMPGDSVQR